MARPLREGKIKGRGGNKKKKKKRKREKKKRHIVNSAH